MPLARRQESLRGPEAPALRRVARRRPWRRADRLAPPALVRRAGRPAHRLRGADDRRRPADARRAARDLARRAAGDAGLAIQAGRGGRPERGLRRARGAPRRLSTDRLTGRRPRGQAQRVARPPVSARDHRRRLAFARRRGRPRAATGPRARAARYARAVAFSRRAAPGPATATFAVLAWTSMR